MPGFAASVRRFADKSKRKLTEVLQQSVIELVREMQTTKAMGGNMPMDTGYLRASIKFSTSVMPQPQAGSRPVAGGAYSYADGEVVSFASGLRYGQTVFIGYTAEYSAIQEYHNGFVKLAAQNWGAIVSRVAERLRVQ